MPPERGRDAAAGASVDLAALLHDGTRQLGLVLDEAVRQRLLRYATLLHTWNATYNLTAIREPARILVHHVLDALAIVPALARRFSLDGTRLVDVGSGAGVPGLPIAIAWPGVRLLSVEPTGKKAAFQRQVCSELALRDVEIHQGRVESLARPADLIVCRAYASLAAFARSTVRLGDAATSLAAMKGQHDEVDRELADLPPGVTTAGVEPIVVPFLDAQRHLVWLMRTPAS